MLHDIKCTTGMRAVSKCEPPAYKGTLDVLHKVIRQVSVCFLACACCFQMCHKLLLMFIQLGFDSLILSEADG